MKLTEIRTETEHYFRDERGRMQGEYNLWWNNERIICYWRDNDIHGEFKEWDRSGVLIVHTFNINNEKIVDFLENPKLYPSTPEDKTMFALKYNIGGAPFMD